MGFPFPRLSKWIAWINKQVCKKNPNAHLLDDHGKYRWKGISRSHLYHPTLQMDEFYLCHSWLSFIWSLFKKIYSPQAILLNASVALFLESFSYFCCSGMSINLQYLSFWKLFSYFCQVFLFARASSPVFPHKLCFSRALIIHIALLCSLMSVLSFPSMVPQARLTELQLSFASAEKSGRIASCIL